MRIQFEIGRYWLGLLGICIGLWFAARQVFDLGPWFTPATLGVLTLTALVAWFFTHRALGWLVGTYMFGFWALYELADLTLGGTLPGSLLLLFWGAAFLLLYGLHTRPFRWPLIPAAALMGLGTFFYVVGVGIATARYWLPVALIIWGISALFRRSQS